ncbi:DUF5615 family PIN-like protein [Promicromonospora sp. CA-289599]|uniref:DUF5615 family PIN-like protein n=1 Tax=Promicromonospora sp. CA-289599 TaxID=3240014 RepID=UPI003D8FFE50
MRLLLDNNLSVRLVELLSTAGHEVQHVRDLGLAAATDAVVLDAAATAGQVLVSADSDFGALLAAGNRSGPSFVLLRRTNGRRAEELAQLLVANLPVIAKDLEAGAIAVVGEDEIRIRSLPIGRARESANDA